MFKRRFSKFGRAFLVVACLFFVGGLQQSCKDWLDDYKYDDSEPDWLGASIYAFLQEGTPSHTYKNYVELIDSLGERETLEKTGSKTLFVADDAAFEQFYANNAWGVTSVADMTVAQRKYLFYNTMLSNAILLDMMPSSNDKDENRGNRLSQTTEFNPIDSVTSLHADYYPKHSLWPTYNKYWSFVGDTAYFAMSSSSMVHFFDDYLRRNAISVSDIDFIFSKGGETSKSYKKGDVYIYGNKLVNGDVDAGTFSEDSLTIVCKNGYIYRMDEVLLPPMDMASELRIHKDTRIFSHLLDRFSFPVINWDLTDKYNEYHANTEKDTIYSLRYFTESLIGSATTLTDPMHPTKKTTAPKDGEWLDYDPATVKGANDIYAMFVPKDEVLYEYFADTEDGAGNFLIKKYAPSVEVEPDYSEGAVDKLLSALDSIPQASIATFINNLMQPSFSGAVPSKFDRVVNDAMDEMGVKAQDVDECKIANNGVLYLLNKVFSPAKYSSVAGPVEIYEHMSIMDNFIIGLKYDYYLLAMDAKYSLIIPDNNSFVYYNPVVYDANTKEQEMYSFHFDGKRKDNGSKTPELWRERFLVNTETHEIIDTLDDKSGRNDYIATDLLEYLIVVHDKVEPSVHKDRLYYSTKGYGTIKIDASGPDHIKFYGGEQLEKGTEIIDSMIISQSNGVTYSTIPAQKSTESLLYSSVPTPPTKSVYKNMLANAKDEKDLYYEFFHLCYPGATAISDALATIYGNPLDVAEDTLKMYSIFYSDDEMENGVSFFNTYHYTVYIPSNEAIKELYAQGLPTWELIAEESKKNPGRAMAMIRLVNNFARYHFQDQSVYHDRSRFFIPDVSGGKNYEATLSTSLINPTTGRFYDMLVMSDENNSTIHVKDEWVKMSQDYNQFKGFNDWAVVNNTDWAQVVNTPAEKENKTWNVMCRDIKKGTDDKATPNEYIKTSSYSVLQPINRALLNKAMFGYDCRFARFAETGERVDTMRVKGGQGGNVGFGQDYYLVAKAGRVPRSTENAPQPKELENVEIAYLMQPITDTHEKWNSYASREVLVYEANEDPTAEKKAILVTRDGYRVDRIETVKNKVTYITYAYHTVTDGSGNEYIIKVNNAGEEIERKLFKEKEVETPEAGDDDSEAENGSNGETNDKE